MTGMAIKSWDDRGEHRDEVLLRARTTDAEGRPAVVTVVNLSSGGLMARCDAGRVAGDRLSVELPVIGRVGVEVRWSLGGRIGCRFDQAIAAERYDRLLSAVRGR